MAVSVLALDVGSSSVRAQLFDETGEPLDELRQEKYEGRDPDEIVELTRRVIDGREGDAVGASCFGHSLLALDAGGRPLTPVLGWRDTRSVDAANWLRRRLDPDAVHARTGCYLHPSYWPAKLAWLAQAEPETFRSAARFVSFCDYLYEQLLGIDAVTSLSIASGTGLVNLADGTWDAELLDAVGVGEERLPQISDEPHGAWYPALFDGACSNLGTGCVGPDRAALMVGTSGALRVLYETDRPQPRAGLFLYRLDGRRVVEGGSLSDGGNLAAWLEKTLRPVEGSLLDRGPDEHGLTFLPFLGGERATGWDPHASGTIHGLSFETTPRDVCQAAVEGIGFRFAAIADLLPGLEHVVASGGALSADPEWVQLLSDTVARPVSVSAVEEASLRGAAVAVLERLGYEPVPTPLGETFDPRDERADAYRSARERHQRLYEVLRGD